ncbi:MAG: hypothetical protein QFF03_21380, partial [Pseudomonadota bacterium]|nr:hypothetical protein [Pseudomonadota bacterium]
SCVEDDSFTPAISIYAEGKVVKVCPDFVDAQRSQWSATAAKARHVLVSGVRGHRQMGNLGCAC